MFHAEALSCTAKLRDDNSARIYLGLTVNELHKHAAHVQWCRGSPGASGGQRHAKHACVWTCACSFLPGERSGLQNSNMSSVSVQKKSTHQNQSELIIIPPPEHQLRLAHQLIPPIHQSTHLRLTSNGLRLRPSRTTQCKYTSPASHSAQRSSMLIRFLTSKSMTGVADAWSVWGVGPGGVCAQYERGSRKNTGAKPYRSKNMPPLPAPRPPTCFARLAVRLKNACYQFTAFIQ